MVLSTLNHERKIILISELGFVSTLKCAYSCEFTEPQLSKRSRMDLSTQNKLIKLYSLIGDFGKSQNKIRP